jgi:protocatechuate 3,4-dioxygenase beta subunit
MARISTLRRRLNMLKKQVFHSPLRRRSMVGFGFVGLLVVAVLGILQFAAATPSAADIAKADNKRIAELFASRAKKAAGKEKYESRGNLHLSKIRELTTTEVASMRYLKFPPANIQWSQHELGKNGYLYFDSPEGDLFYWEFAPSENKEIKDFEGKPLKTTFYGAYSPDWENVFAKDSASSLAIRAKFGMESKNSILVEVGQIVLARTVYDPTTIYILKIKQQSPDKESLTIEYAKIEAVSSTEETNAAKNADDAAKTSSLRVSVVDESGKPLPRTKLNVIYWGPGKDYTTDAEGRATVVVPEPNRHPLSLIASPEGYPPMRKWWKNDAGNDLIPAEFTFTFVQGRTIGGVVRDEQGKPIEGVLVHLSITMMNAEKSGLCLALWDHPLQTDSEGRWRLDHIPQPVESMAIRLEHSDYVNVGYLQSLPVTEQQKIEDRTSIMVMKKGFPIEGTVTDPEGKPVADAWVALGDDRNGSDFPATHTDLAGHYKFSSLAAGGAVVTVVSRGLAPAIRNLNVAAGMQPVDFRLEKGGTIRVQVVDHNDRPLEGVSLWPDTWRGHRTLGSAGIAGKTDAEGRWSWAWAPKDTVEFSVRKDGYARIGRLPLMPEEDEQKIVLSPKLTISGKVVDAETKQPLPSFHAIRGVIPDQNNENQWVSWDRREIVEGKDGQYAVTFNDPTKENVVRIEADGYKPVTSRNFKHGEGSVNCDFALTKGKVFDVPVRFPDGKPAQGAEAYLCPEMQGKFHNMALFVSKGQIPHQMAKSDPSKISMTVGSDGILHIQPQNDGYVLLLIHDLGFAQTTSEELVAKPEIALRAWARLEGVIRHGAKPAAGAKLRANVREPYNPRWGFLNIREEAEADADGKFVFAKLKPGMWEVSEMPSDDSPAAIRSAREYQKTIELAPGQTGHVTLGGTGRPVVGKIEWPEGKPPEGDLAHIGGSLSIKIPQRASPPKEVVDQGPDAVRAWLKQWDTSEEGKQWRKNLPDGSRCSQMVTVDPRGSIHIEGVEAGKYELDIYVQEKGDTLPWERSPLRRYECDVSVPEIPGGVSEEPLDLGKVALIDKSPKRFSFDGVSPPAPQATGEKSVGGPRENKELLRYLIATYQQNKAKIRSWQGQATIQNRTVYNINNEKEMSGVDYFAKVQFVFDREQKSVRWNDTLEKSSQITQGKEEPQSVPKILNGMMTPKALYRFGLYGSPGDPAKRQLTLKIAPPEDIDGRMQTQLYDFNPLVFLDTFRGDVAEDLSSYLGWADEHGAAGTKITREGDLVTIDMGTNDMYNRYTLSLSQGCNPVTCSGVEPRMTSEYRWTYENRDGIWLPKTWTYTVREKDRRTEDRTVTFVENVLNEKVDADAFTIPKLGVKRGDEVDDRRTKQRYQYEGE